MKFNYEFFELEKVLTKLENLHSSFDYLRITIASPERMKLWAERTLPHGEIVGEVLRAETINFRSHQPEAYGLFCEKIFGPLKNWKCKCGKYNGFVVDKICEECHVEIVESRVRRYRMGYIDLTCPITHLWYLKGTPSYLTTIISVLQKKTKISHIESIIYFREHKIGSKPNPVTTCFKKIVFKSGGNSKNELIPFLKRGSGLDRNNFSLKKRSGSEILKTILESIQLDIQILRLRDFTEYITRFGLRSKSITNERLKIRVRQLRIFESFQSTKTKLTWMILTILPVLPPSLRPLLELENGRLVAADVNEIYRLIITRNQRLLDFRSLSIPELVTTQSKKLLQESVDSLIDNARVQKDRKVMLNNKALKSLSEILEGKQGRFRQSLLGKRVDYSARSVIVVGPNLRLNQCGLPYQIGLELFQPFLINELLQTKIKVPSYNTKLASIIIKKNKPFVWTLLTELIKKYSVLLNRAPTLHRFGIQAFDPVLILGQAIHLHPLVCTGFNADFDGDQMAIHLPLYEASQLEIRTMMRPSYNVLSPANGEVILKPTQDMVIGCYYLTVMVYKQKQMLKKWFASEKDALKAFYSKQITIHTPILVRYKIYNLNFQFNQKTLKFFELKNQVLFKEKEIRIDRFFPNRTGKKLYLLTKIGIFIASLNNFEKKDYSITDFFLETTPGRLIFSLNFKDIFQR